MTTKITQDNICIWISILHLFPSEKQPLPSQHTGDVVSWNQSVAYSYWTHAFCKCRCEWTSTGWQNLQRILKWKIYRVLWQIPHIPGNLEGCIHIQGANLVLVTWAEALCRQEVKKKVELQNACQSVKALI